MATTIKGPKISQESVLKTEWSKIIDDEFIMKEEYVKGLARLSWMKEFDIGYEKIYITFAQNAKPLMNELEKIFANNNIDSLVNLIEERTNNDDVESGFHPGPRKHGRDCMQMRSEDEWFEENVLDENYDIKEVYVNELISGRFSSINGFYTGSDKEKKSWQMCITYARNTEPCMQDLKNLFGDNIEPFVKFIPESDANDKKLRFLRAPGSGDLLKERGIMGVAAAQVQRTKEHYATSRDATGCIGSSIQRLSRRTVTPSFDRHPEDKIWRAAKKMKRCHEFPLEKGDLFKEHDSGAI